MKSPALILFSVVSALSTEASAALHTYQFTSSIQSMFEHDAQSGTNTFVGSSSLSGYNIHVGDLVIGRFTYDDAALPSPFDTNGTADGYLVFASAVTAFDLGIASSGFTYSAAFGAGSNIVLSDDSTHPSGWDTFSPFSEAAYSPTEFSSANINLFDQTGTAVNGYSALPSTLSLPSFHYSDLHYAWLRRSDGDQFHFNGSLTSLIEVSAVPEPSSALLLLLGGLALSISRRRGEA